MRNEILILVLMKMCVDVKFTGALLCLATWITDAVIWYQLL